MLAAASICFALCTVASAQEAQTVRVGNIGQIRQAIASARPGTTILIESGEYSGGLQFSNVKGIEGKPIVIAGADPKKPPRFAGNNTGMQFSSVAWLEIRDIEIRGAAYNGLNIDDGGSITSPSHHVTLKNIFVSDLPKGNHDGIKLSGLDDFRIENCTVERWGGSAIDMVGCHKGVIVGCIFRAGGDNGVQCKGGTSQIRIQKCLFEGSGQRGVNIGGSTGLQFFRPALDKMPAAGKYEAKEITVEGCTFAGSVAPIAFVGVDGSTVRFNTIYNPERWAIRILQETRVEGFVPSRNGIFEDNLIVFRSDAWASGGLNIGDATAPATFRFARNFWFCSDRPDRSRPTLPTAESNGNYGVDPLLKDPAKGDFGVRAGSPAQRVGAHAFKAL